MTAGQPLPTAKTREQIASDLIGVFANLWPRAFALYQHRRKPLKLGVDRDIEAAAGGAITAEEIEIALRSYCRNVGYLRACRESAVRVGLDGEPAGFVSAGEAASAASSLAFKRQKELARAAAKAPAAAPPAIAAPPRLTLDAAERRQREAQP